MRRIWILFAVQSIAFAAVGLRLFQVQILSGTEYRLQAAKQHFDELVIPASRGSIVTTDGSPLVLNEPAYLMYAEPPRINDPVSFAEALSGVPEIGIEKAALITQISEPGRMWVPISRQLSIELADKIKDLNIPGLGFEKEFRRFYPEASMAAHLTGFVGRDEHGGATGYFGIEGYYKRELTGIDGVIRQERDARGLPIMMADRKRFEPVDGSTLVLHLDRTVQRIVQNRLAEGITKYGAKSGTVTVIDPRTGAVLAMAALPAYDQSDHEAFEPSLYRNPVIAEAYEPGSTFKVLIMGSAIEENRVKPTTIVDESGPVQIGKYSIRTWDNKYHGQITVTDVLKHSSNVGMVRVGQLLGPEKLIQYLKAFGLGVPTGIDLQEETSPDIRADNEWKDIDLATVTFGQGIAVTPIQMVRAVSALANGGWIMEPKVVREIRGSNGMVSEIKPKRQRQVISASAARVMTEMMIAAVDYGEAKWAKPKGYRIAGKTGTAQIPVAGHYDDKKTIASFIGFAPADEPAFVMLVTLREPASSPWGSETAAPLFFRIAGDLLTYYGLPPQ